MTWSSVIGAARGLAYSGVVLVTGGAGYVGSHACKALEAAGYLPVDYDNLVSGCAAAVKWGPLERGDILDRRRLDQAITHWWPVAIMHFAAAPASQHRLDLWAQYSVYVQGSLTLMEAALNRGITQFVLSSSCAVYGSPGQGPLPGHAPQSPMSREGQSKFMAERMLEQIGRLSGLRSMILRYGCAAGADPRCHIGESHDPETDLIPILLDAASRKREAAGSGLCRRGLRARRHPCKRRGGRACGRVEGAGRRRALRGVQSWARPRLFTRRGDCRGGGGHGT